MKLRKNVSNFLALFVFGALLVNAYKEITFDSEGILPAAEIASAFGYENLVWKETYTAPMLPKRGCGPIPPSRLTEFKAERYGLPTKVFVCEWVYFKPVVMNP